MTKVRVLEAEAEKVSGFSENMMEIERELVEWKTKANLSAEENAQLVTKNATLMDADSQLAIVKSERMALLANVDRLTEDLGIQKEGRAKIEGAMDVLRLELQSAKQDVAEARERLDEAEARSVKPLPGV